MYLFSLLFVKASQPIKKTRESLLNEFKDFYNPEKYESADLVGKIDVLSSLQIMLVRLEFQMANYNSKHKEHAQDNLTVEKKFNLIQTELQNNLRQFFEYLKLTNIKERLENLNILVVDIFNRKDGLNDDMIIVLFSKFFYSFAMSKGRMTIKEIYGKLSNIIEKSELQETIKSDLLAKLNKIKFLVDEDSYTLTHLKDLVEKVKLSPENKFGDY